MRSKINRIGESKNTKQTINFPLRSSLFHRGKRNDWLAEWSTRQQSFFSSTNAATGMVEMKFGKKNRIPENKASFDLWLSSGWLSHSKTWLLAVRSCPLHKLQILSSFHLLESV